MKTWTEVIGKGRSQIEVTVTVKEHADRTPEENRIVMEAVWRVLGEPTPEMYEPRDKPSPETQKRRDRPAKGPSDK
jgi:hypothetical protein